MRSFCCCFYPAAVALHCVLLFYTFFFTFQSVRVAATRCKRFERQRSTGALPPIRTAERQPKRESRRVPNDAAPLHYRYHYHRNGAQSRSLCAAVLCCKRSYIPRPNFSCFSLVFPVGQRFAAARTRFGPTLVASWPLCNDSETKVLTKWPSCSLIGRRSVPRGQPKFSRENPRALSPSLLGDMRQQRKAKTLEQSRSQVFRLAHTPYNPHFLRTLNSSLSAIILQFVHYKQIN